jgi:hypothetical protein
MPQEHKTFVPQRDLKTRGNAKRYCRGFIFCRLAFRQMRLAVVLIRLLATDEHAKSMTTIPVNLAERLGRVDLL